MLQFFQSAWVCLVAYTAFFNLPPVSWNLLCRLPLETVKRNVICKPGNRVSESLCTWLADWISKYCSVHCCGTGGSMRACHAAGLGLIPGRDKFLGWGFFGVFPHLWDKCQEALGPKVPKYHLAIIIHNHSLWAPMTWDVDAPFNPNIHTYK